MASFFQPGPSQSDTSTTPSPANQAEQKFRIEMLGRILNSMAGTAPSFASFAAGGPAQRQFPSGFGPDIASLLNAMNQPGAFTSTASQTGQGPTPSGISDVTQIAGLAYLLSQLGINPIQWLLKGVGGGAGTPLDSAPAASPGFLGSLSTGDQPGVNFTPDPSQGMTMDPSQGMSTVDPNAIDPSILNMLWGL
jgi:hypothetical protein